MDNETVKVSFDFDGTLNRDDIKEYARDLIDRGVEVWVCTSRASNPKIKHGGRILEPNKDLFEITDNLNIPRERILFTEGELKSETLFKHEFLFHVDDDSIELMDMALGYKGINIGMPAGISAYDDYRKECEECLIIRKMSDPIENINVVNSMKFWIFYEDNQAVYCKDCIDQRIDQANKNLEFKDYYNYQNGESTSCMTDWADEEDNCVCELCQRQMVTGYID